MNQLMFDNQDIQILADRFTLKELRAERDSALLKMKSADFWYEPDVQYWQEYHELCDVTIKRILQAQRKQAITTPTPGHIDIESVKAKSDIVDVVSRYIQLKKSGKRFSGLCPFHNDKDTPSLVVYPDKQNWRCFGCQKRGDVIDFITEVEHTDFRGAVNILGG